MKVNLVDRLAANRKKREVIEQLIQYAKQLLIAGDSLEALQFAALPSQNIKRKPAHFHQELMDQLQVFSTEQLKQHLPGLDQVLVKDVQFIVSIAQLSEVDLIQRFRSTSTRRLKKSFEDLHDLLDDFRTKAQKNVAIRLILQERGARVAAVKLPVAQEELTDHLQEIHQRESECRQKIQHGVEELLMDTQDLLANTLLPEEIQHQLSITERRLRVALHHLKKGGDLEQLPFTLELDICDDDYTASCHTPEPMEDTSAADKPASQPASEVVNSRVSEPAVGKPVKPVGFFTLLKRWVMSPWNVSWSDVKRQSQQEGTERGADKG